MIIVKLMGGLGNQMFQYAAARKLAVLHNVPFKMDVGAFQNIDKYYRVYSLHVFRAVECFAASEEIAQLLGHKKRQKDGLWHRINKKFMPFYKRSYVKERKANFDPAILKLSKNVYLDGYWQTERYFKDIEDIIRQDFEFKYDLEGKNKQIADQILDSISVSIHVRRGDYVSENSINRFHGVCGLDYYKKSISMIVEKVGKPHFYVFSDDMDWVKNNLHINYPAIYVDNNQNEKDYEDMRLMSMCKHNIIANSTFSWWGAWLNSNPDKIVIAPKRWFKADEYNIKDLFPEGWMRIQ